MMKKILLLPVLAFALVGCHHDCDDGKIPAQYVGQAQQYQGQFYGEFDGKPTEMGLWLDYDKPYVVVQNQYNDLLGADCHSHVGQLQSVDVAQFQGQHYVEQAEFDFHPGQCQQDMAQQIQLDFAPDANQFQATIYSADKTKSRTGRFYRRF